MRRNFAVLQLILFAGVIAILIALAGGCNNWERTTFQTLAASKAVIDQAHTDYANRTIPQTHCANAFISNAVTADSAAVQAFKAYKQLSDSKGNTTEQVAIVNADLATLAPLIVQLQALIAHPTSVCTEAADAAAIKAGVN